MTTGRPSMRASLILLAIGLAAAAWRMPHAAVPRFLVAPVMAASEMPSHLATFQMHSLPQPTPSAHASSIAVMQDGSLRVAWFGGEREGARDVAIHMAQYESRNGEVRPVLISTKATDGAPATTQQGWVSLTRERLQTLTSRVIRKLGNPVLWVDGAGRLHMHVVSVSYGGWSGSAINQLVSEDGGHTWTSARRLILSPLFNLSTLVRNQPIMMEDGTLGLPAYHELIQKWGVWTHLTTDGRVLQSTAMKRYEGGWLQPAVAALSPTEACAVLRSATTRTKRVGHAVSSNGGVSWSERTALDVPNPNASVAMIRLMDGSLLMAANPLESGRNVLQLFRSRDGGQTWVASRTVERSADTGAEFSYPFLVQGPDGSVHLSYTWLRKGIRLCTFTPEWLDAVADDAPAVPNIEGTP
ncbi:MAG: exo-alpha-sialidase [Planctomycetaceae bacterium]|nr:exo-alpha-sialidase [Planctomycetaceae bacterium]